MSEKTKIGWCDSTGNPWLGCTKVSPGCKNCYAAELDANRFSKTMGGGTVAKPESHWGKGAPRVRTKAFWTDAVKWNRENTPVRCQSCGCSNPAILGAGSDIKCTEEIDGRYCGGRLMRERKRIFPSLCDWLDDEVPIEWLADFLKLIHDTPNLNWLLLTKRPENFVKGLLVAGMHLMGYRHQTSVEPTNFPSASEGTIESILGWSKGETFPHNVWIGVSVEDQKRADERIPLLLQIPAKVRFLSVEPLLEPVRINKASWIFDTDSHQMTGQFRSDPITGKRQIGVRIPKGTSHLLHWVIVGGESGKDRRDCGVEAICDVARQCVAAGVPCFVKQDCAFKPGQQGRIPDEVWAFKQFPTIPLPLV